MTLFAITPQHTAILKRERVLKSSKLAICLGLTLGIFSLEAYSNNKVIYGEDNRVLTEMEADASLQDLARSTAAMVPAEKCQTNEDGSVAIKGTALKDTFNKVCPDEKFAQLITAPVCSGFLVGPDLLVTAGHCIKDQSACDKNFWVFDFKNEQAKSATEYTASKDQVYKCTSIVSRKLNRVSKNDYALVKLDRVVENREPLKFRTEGQIAEGTELVVIGHPSGLPSIIAAGSKVRKNVSEWYFNANLDTFGGNSGSAVFNMETKEVEGILVRGERDYKMDQEAGCKRVFKCEDDKCRGEDITRITVIPELVPGMTPEEPEDNGFDFNGLFGGLGGIGLPELPEFNFNNL